MADTVNGFPILRSHATPRTASCDPGRIVLVDLERKVPMQVYVTRQWGEYRYAVGWVRDGADHWSESAYFAEDEMLNAEVEYGKRIEREERR